VSTYACVEPVPVLSSSSILLRGVQILNFIFAAYLSCPYPYFVCTLTYPYLFFFSWTTLLLLSTTCILCPLPLFSAHCISHYVLPATPLSPYTLSPAPLHQNLLADESDITVELTSPADLAGLPEDLIAAARQAAEARGLTSSNPDAAVVTLSRSLVEPFITFSECRPLREKAWRLWTNRGKCCSTVVLWCCDAVML
jgi:hypothetical protein